MRAGLTLPKAMRHVSMTLEYGRPETASLLLERNGYAASVTGGSEGSNYLVTTTANSGAGSLRAALESSNAYTITFDPSLTGRINNNITIKPNKTIDGRGANAGLYFGTDDGFGFYMDGSINGTTANVIFAYLTMEGGTVDNDHCLVGLNGADLVWIHHCTLSDAQDGVFTNSRWYGSRDFSSVSTTDNEITTTTNISGLFATGDVVRVGVRDPNGATAVLPSPLVVQTNYYAIVTATNKFKLAASQADALAGTPVIDLTSAGSGNRLVAVERLTRWTIDNCIIGPNPGARCYAAGSRTGKAFQHGETPNDNTWAACRATMHHNIFRNCIQRQPLLHSGSFDLYNNYYIDWGGPDQTVEGGVGLQLGAYADVLVEANLYEPYNVGDTHNWVDYGFNTDHGAGPGICNNPDKEGTKAAGTGTTGSKIKKLNNVLRNSATLMNDINASSVTDFNALYSRTVDTPSDSGWDTNMLATCGNQQ